MSLPYIWVRKLTCKSKNYLLRLEGSTLWEEGGGMLTEGRNLWDSGQKLRDKGRRMVNDVCAGHTGNKKSQSLWSEGISLREQGYRLMMEAATLQDTGASIQGAGHRILEKVAHMCPLHFWDVEWQTVPRHRRCSQTASNCLPATTNNRQKG
jgi:hypothetical protein